MSPVMGDWRRRVADPQVLNSKQRGFAGAGLVQPHSQNAHSQNAHLQNADYRGGSEDSAPHESLPRCGESHGHEMMMLIPKSNQEIE